MKIDNTLCISNNPVLTGNGCVSNISFRQEPMKIVTNSKGEKYANVYVLDKV